MNAPSDRNGDPDGSAIVEDYFDAWIEEQAGSPAPAEGARRQGAASNSDGADTGTLSAVFERTARCAELLQAAWPSQRATNTGPPHGRRGALTTDFNGALSRSAGPRGAPDLGGAPERIGRFVIEAEIGRGRFGVVYRAYDSRLQRDVALKIARPEVAGKPDLNDRFLREAAAVARLDHPGIVPVHEAGEADGYLFYIMPYCKGENLAEWLAGQQGPVDQRTAANIVRRVAEAVHYGHARGVVHRDLKPANIMLVPAEERDAVERPSGKGNTRTVTEPAGGLQPRVLDFGLSRSLEEELHDTRSSMIIGTPLYMSPEQARHPVGEVGVASDIFALGAILYELLTGVAPFAADTLPEIIERLKSCEPVPPGARRGDVDPRLETICLKCLRLYPEDRYDSAHELADDLRRFLSGEPIQARQVTWLDRARWWARSPLRIRDAGIVAVGLNTAVACTAPLNIASLLLGLDIAVVAVSRTRLLLEFAMILVLHAALAWNGMRILKGRRGALETGAFAAAALCVLFTAVLFFGAPATSIYEDNPLARWLLYMMGWILFTIQLAVFLAGLYAHRMRHR